MQPDLDQVAGYCASKSLFGTEGTCEPNHHRDKGDEIPQER
jgi:hypothetical protein